MHPLGSQPRSPLPAFRRTAASCQYCQLRKIRCDRKILGSPCTNCRLDDITCMPGHSKKKPIPRSLELPHSSTPKSPNSETMWEVGREGQSHFDQTTNRPHLPGIEDRLPHFIKPLPSHLTAEDADYLRYKGVFEIPDGQPRFEILCSYVQFAHPLLPLLDLENFLGPIMENNQSPGLSLLLFYAVMCSGAAHVHIDSLQALGYDTRKSARRAFFERARVS